MAARDTALAALITCRRQGAWSDGALKELIRRDGLDRREAALASRLCYGVLQNRALLDFYISSFLRGSMGSLQPVVLDILRLGAFQLTLTDKIPPSAAVNCAVEQAKRSANRQAAGLVNGVLRTLTRQKDHLPQPPDLATKYSHPQELVDLLTRAVGCDKIEPLLSAHNQAPAMAVQVNTLRTSSEALAERLAAEGVGAEPHPWLAGCLILSHSGSIEQLPSFQEGLFYVQDPAARLAALCAGVRPGMTVLDCCAAPGGKSFACAIAMENQGTLISCDIHSHKIRLLQAGAGRLGLSILHPQEQDAASFHAPWAEQMDVVLADVPCSGLGVIRKKPDIRYKNLAEIQNLPRIQGKILNNQANYVKPGGVLLYSTCTILPQENEQVVASFLQAHPEFSLEPLGLPEPLPSGPMATLLPCDHGTDGFFICKMRKHHD